MFFSGHYTESHQTLSHQRHYTESFGSSTQSCDNKRLTKTTENICISHKIPSAGRGGTPTLAALSVHFDLSVLATSHPQAEHCESNLLCRKRDEMGPVERWLHNLCLFVCVWPSNGRVTGRMETLSKTATQVSLSREIWAVKTMARRDSFHSTSQSW